MKPVSAVDPSITPAVEVAASRHVGRGARAIAEALAQASGKTTEEILGMRAPGHGFGRIARQLGLNLGAIRSGRHTPTPPAPDAITGAVTTERPAAIGSDASGPRDGEPAAMSTPTGASGPTPPIVDELI